MNLQGSQSCPAIVMNDGINGKTIPQAMRGNKMEFAGFCVNELGKFRSFGTFFDYLPGSVAINAKDEFFTIFLDRPTSVDEVS